MNWTVRLYESAPWKRYVILLFAVAAGALGYAMVPHPFFAVFGFIAILASTAEFWMPLKYQMNEKRASVKAGFSVTAIEWSEIKRAICAPEAVKLSPLKETGRLSAFRGVTLRYAGNAEEVLAYVKEHLPEDARVVEFRAD
ncbi:MAG: hypothetical protein HZC36_12595 [Armatimonadetes bacterium]|nr:hypothetical protein [Armatimonadota bacterium]